MAAFATTDESQRLERALLIRLLARLLAEQDEPTDEQEDDEEVPMVRTHVEPLGGA